MDAATLIHLGNAHRIFYDSTASPFLLSSFFVTNVEDIPMKLSAALSLCCLAVLTLSVSPQTATPDATVAAQVAAAPANSPDTYTLPPDKLQKATALYTLRGRLRILDTVFSFMVLLVLLYFGIVARYRNLAERASRWSFVQA